jgi:hypothetical protein
MIAISLIVLTVIAGHDSLTLRAIQAEEDTLASQLRSHGRVGFLEPSRCGPH